jgi:hypothetical protein
MIRLASLKTFGLTADPTWDNIPTTFWSTIETSTAIFCCCMPAIRAGVIHFFPKILRPSTHSGTMSPEKSSKSPDDQLAPSRVVEGKHGGNPISLLSTTISAKAHQSHTATTYETTEVGTNESETKYDIGSIRHITLVTEYLRRIERDKPLPLLPIPNTSHSPKLNAKGEELREVGDLAENSSSALQHSKSFV